MSGVREHRVRAFCDWLCTIEPDPPFPARPEFRFFSDLTDAEFDAAADEIGRRSAAAFAEAAELAVYGRSRGMLIPDNDEADGPEAA